MRYALPSDVILNRQRALRIPMSQLRKFLGRAGTALGLRPGSFTVCLVKKAQIAKWNRAYRHRSGPTDVLSFPAATEFPHSRPRPRKTPGRAARGQPAAGSDSESHEPYLGDIAIAPAVARRNAHRFGRTFSEELRILILHGMLHLMGYDHETDAGQMDRRERTLRRRLGLG